MTRSWQTLGNGQLTKLRDDIEFRRYNGHRQGRGLEVYSADGTRIHVEISGPEDGYPIVLSHGMSCSIDFWVNQIQELALEYRVIAYDQRGHGRSERPRRTGGLADRLGDDLAAVLSATLRPGERALIAGHSTGGIAIQSWAHRHPESVRQRADTVALINTAAGDVLREWTLLPCPNWTHGFRDRHGSTAIGLLSGAPMPARLPGRAALTSLALSPEATPAARALLQEQLLTTAAATRRRFGRELLGLRSDSYDPASLTVPTLVICGADDRIMPVRQSYALADRLPELIGVIELPGGHCAPLEQRVEVNRQLRRLARMGMNTAVCQPIR
ncbi:alpha/beta hydrolase [Nocardia sp. CDC159]|uniref:Alpha/beta hydrolase n=1 Tax=Nocardia pulmonis TaxID=2951408 RepID=A0A9X2EFP9_9NOCA|nr:MULTISPECIES: alpha/beta hydrolase [Nocardia]MCM6778650.1 alpha/beta hydrolase [Nocardia pulmonis]MCM6791539.1 alpha/beta hydrolase [Nocardia sp. CDC159]